MNQRRRDLKQFPPKPVYITWWTSMVQVLIQVVEEAIVTDFVCLFMSSVSNK